LRAAAKRTQFSLSHIHAAIERIQMDSIHAKEAVLVITHSKASYDGEIAKSETELLILLDDVRILFEKELPRVYS
jgi:hypothetical protein